MYPSFFYHAAKAAFPRANLNRLKTYHGSQAPMIKSIHSFTHSFSKFLLLPTKYQIYHSRFWSYINNRVRQSPCPQGVYSLVGSSQQLEGRL